MKTKEKTIPPSNPTSPNSNNLKEDWVMCTFEDLTESLKRGPFGGDLKKAFFVESGYRVYEQQHAIKNDFSLGRYFIDEERFQKLNACKVGPDDFIVSCSGTMGKIARLPKDATIGVINQALLKIRINENIIDANYFIEFFRSNFFQRKILKDSRGSGMQNMAGIKEIKPILLELPSLVEQKSIVKKIEQLFSSLDSGIADLKKAQEQLKIYRQAVLKKAFEGEYPQVKIIDISEVKTGSTPKRGNQKYWNNGTIPWVTSGALNNLFVNESKEFITEIALKETNCKIIKKGSLLVAMYGEGKTRGKCSELNIDAATNQAVATITLKEEFKESKLFVKWFFLKNYEQIRLLSSGGVQPNLNLSIIKNTVIPFPSSKEQTEIVRQIESRLSVCDKVEQSISESLEKAKALRQSILKKAFEGKLLSKEEIAECKKAPDYEPASVLLEKIKTEKQKNIKTKKKK